MEVTVFVEGISYRIGGVNTILDIRKAMFNIFTMFINEIRINDVYYPDYYIIKSTDLTFEGFADVANYTNYHGSKFRCKKCLKEYLKDIHKCYHTNSCRLEISKNRQKPKQEIYSQTINSSISSINLSLTTASIDNLPISLVNSDNSVKNEKILVFEDISDVKKGTHQEENDSSIFSNKVPLEVTDSNSNLSLDKKDDNHINGSPLKIKNLSVIDAFKSFFNLNEKIKIEKSNFPELLDFSSSNQKKDENKLSDEKCEIIDKSNTTNNFFFSIIDESNTTEDGSQKSENKIIMDDLPSIETSSNTNLKDESSECAKTVKFRLGKLKFMRIKQEKAIKFLEPMFSRISYDHMMKLSESHDYIAIMREKVVLAAAVVKKFTASENIHYCDLVFIGVKPKRRGYGKRMLNMLIRKYKKIMVYSDKSVIKFYKQSKFTQAKSLAYPLASQIKCYRNSLLMKFGFNKMEISDIKKWGTEVSDGIKEKNRSKAKGNENDKCK